MHAILDPYSNVINKEIENQEKPSWIFLDLAQAFDMANHDILLDKLKYYGTRGKQLSWFESY